MKDEKLWIIAEPNRWNHTGGSVWIMKAKSAQEAKARLIQRRKRAGYITHMRDLKAKPLSSLRDGLKVV